ncbi:MAG: 23S rRNA (pseudouridine(1915)-N(3))-methyltransferase RlmH [Clostridia bacterium]|nr:23S rRNA (pseudouridine(1915)-N(3))-methyltransferase RlmH [Clostridia bacterium]
MLTFRIITVGTLKEGYWRDAVAEYKKRLSGFCRVEEINLKESKLSEDPSPAQVAAALDAEAEAMKDYLPSRAYKIALCVEGKQFSSEQLAARIDEVSARASEICLVIGSSHGISPKIKQMCDMKLSFSELTFPHQLARVVLYEVLYRCMNIIKGTKYHK